MTRDRARGFDVVVIGAGAAGLHCAALAGACGLRVLLLDHAAKVAEKIRISGGGRCNFTNRSVGAEHFLSDNPEFCRSALARYTPADFLALLARHRIGWHEKHRGQLFCDDGSGRLITMLLAECAAASVERWQPCRVGEVDRAADAFRIDTERGEVCAGALVIATGGLSVPAIGASDFGYRLARRFGHRVIEPRPALVPLVFDAGFWQPYAALAGVSLPVAITTGTGRSAARFEEDLLFTHRGLSGPAALQVSSYWRAGQAITIDLAVGIDLADGLRCAKATARRRLDTALSQWLPQRLVAAWLHAHGFAGDRPVAEVPDRRLAELAATLSAWRVVPSGTEGWRKAEVTAGGIDTRELSSQTMESRLQPGLYCIGEVVDVTGWLGGYNFQWAWASAAACAHALRPVGGRTGVCG